MSNFNSSVIKEIANCTEYNDHCRALILASKMLGYSKLEQVFTKVGEIANIEGGYDSKLMEYRYSRYQELMLLAENDLTGLQFQNLYGAF